MNREMVQHWEPELRFAVEHSNATFDCCRPGSSCRAVAQNKFAGKKPCLHPPKQRRLEAALRLDSLANHGVAPFLVSKTSVLWQSERRWVAKLSCGWNLSVNGRLVPLHG